MTYFKDKTNGVHFLDDASFAHLLPDGCVAISDDEAAQLQAPRTPSAEEVKAAIQKQIDDLERGYMMPRATREALLAYAVTLAEAKGGTEAQLYAANIAYRKVKDFDQQIAALRAKL